METPFQNFSLRSCYGPSPNLFVTTRASMRPSSTVAVSRRLSKLTEEHDLPVTACKTLDRRAINLEGGCFSTPSTPLNPPLQALIILQWICSLEWFSQDVLANEIVQVVLRAFSNSPGTTGSSTHKMMPFEDYRKLKKSQETKASMWGLLSAFGGMMSSSIIITPDTFAIAPKEIQPIM